MSIINTVLFDLDGTLIDTAPDMANALNLLLLEEGCPKLEFESIRPIVSNGSAALVQLGFPQINETETIERLKKRYLEIYKANLYVDTKLFTGMERLLLDIEDKQMNWGVVTNKPGWLTEPLMKQMGLSDRASCIISGDTTKNRKPHPEPMYLACKLSLSKPHHCIYIGDAKRDILAGKNAGMRTVIAKYGYISEDENITSWGADYSIDQPQEVMQYI